MLGCNLADLEVGAGGDVAVAAAMGIGEIGDAGELPVVQDAVGDAQAAHVGILRRGDPEQAVIAPAEIVLGLRRLAGRGLGDQAVMALERILGPLPLLLVAELAAREGAQ